MEKWVCIHWSKFGKEVESVATFDTELDAEACADDIRMHWFNFNGDFIADPRESVTVMLRSEWEA